MRTDGVFTTHIYTIPFESYGVPVYLLPFGDVHKSSPMHSKNRWNEFLEWAKGKKNCYFLGMGDYNDIGSTSERRILNDSDLHDSTTKTLEDLYLAQTKAFAKDISFMKGKILGILGGNHYGQFQSGITTDQKLAELMNTKYLGVNSFIRLRFNYMKGGSKHHSNAIDIFAHHGRGGGRTQGGSMNPVEQMMRVADADIYLMGDNHQKSVSHVSKLRLSVTQNNSVVVQRKILLARTGSFLKGYEEGEKSYIVDGLMPPSDLGVVKIELTPQRETTDSARCSVTRIDIHASI